MLAYITCQRKPDFVGIKHLITQTWLCWRITHDNANLIMLAYIT